ncbi:hypothetical protein PACTADRAFT_31281 [Pachysolen tannophilus NRRL Y-2460]|uniref:Proteasome alpha-type subunits domain-containing protein n=1 Tax=Pachysolen tannophilus NRRL Y-2460 TaxID=669874 RepID=A0A1E4U1H0_PACTA|nr:hypothetical protein PACTADRAFT_31281 [Pachysolen tannophilus NRRL Y-2460]
MFRNNYDNDPVTYSPTGRLFQVEYANEATKQGSATIGLRGKDHVVLLGLKRNLEELGSYQRKIIKIDEHLGCSLAGLAPDARVLSNYLRQQAMTSKMIFNRPLATEKAVYSIADKAQANTQSYGNRPYGVGLIIAGYDVTGPHLFEFSPSGSVVELYGSALGARSQGGKTYLERNLDSFKDEENFENLIKAGLYALRDTLSQDRELTFKNTSIAVVGKGVPFTQYDDEDVQQWLDKLDSVSNKRSTDDNNDGGDDDEDDDNDDNNNKDGGDKKEKTEVKEEEKEEAKPKEEEQEKADESVSEDRMDTD